MCAGTKNSSPSNSLQNKAEYTHTHKKDPERKHRKQQTLGKVFGYTLAALLIKITAPEWCCKKPGDFKFQGRAGLESPCDYFPNSPKRAPTKKGRMPLKTTKLNELALIDFRAFARACRPLGRALGTTQRKSFTCSFFSTRTLQETQFETARNSIMEKVVYIPPCFFFIPAAVLVRFLKYVPG